MNQEKGMTMTDLERLRHDYQHALKMRLDSAVRIANLAVKHIEPAQWDIDRYVSLTEAENVAWKTYYNEKTKDEA